MTTVPAIRGKIGNIEYFQCTMNAHDLVARTQNATEYFSKQDWEEMGDWGKNQREVDKRYLRLIPRAWELINIRIDNQIFSELKKLLNQDFKKELNAN